MPISFFEFSLDFFFVIIFFLQGKINENKLSAEQKKFADPIFKAAAKKGGFKIKRYYMSRQPQAEIEVYKYGKDSGSLWSIWGQTFTKKEADAIKKVVEKSDQKGTLDGGARG